jgi:hypothetical protein
LNRVDKIKESVEALATKVWKKKKIDLKECTIVGGPWHQKHLDYVMFKSAFY